MKLYGMDIKTSYDGKPVLSGEQIELLAERFLSDVKPELLKEPQITPLEEIIEVSLGYDLDFKALSPDDSILGMTTFSEGYTRVFNKEENREEIITILKPTVFADESLLDEKQNSRFRFTLAHEIGHGLIHPSYYLMQQKQGRLENGMACAKRCKKSSIENKRQSMDKNIDWLEWQANAFASAILMPAPTLKMIVHDEVAKYKKCDQQDFTPDLFENWVCQVIGETFGASYTAVSFRLQKCGYSKGSRIILSI